MKTRYNANSTCWGIDLDAVGGMETRDFDGKYFIDFVDKTGRALQTWWCRDKDERNEVFNKVYDLWS